MKPPTGAAKHIVNFLPKDWGVPRDWQKWSVIGWQLGETYLAWLVNEVLSNFLFLFVCSWVKTWQLLASKCPSPLRLWEVGLWCRKSSVRLSYKAPHTALDSKSSLHQTTSGIQPKDRSREAMLLSLRMLLWVTIVKWPPALCQPWATVTLIGHLRLFLTKTDFRPFHSEWTSLHSFRNVLSHFHSVVKNRV